MIKPNIETRHLIIVRRRLLAITFAVFLCGAFLGLLLCHC